MKNFILVIVMCLSFVSCEKAVTFDLDQVSSKLVVEATIENGQYPFVILSRSLNYFSEISPDILDSSFVKGAEVFVSNGVLTHKLKEYSRPIGSGYVFNYYSVDSSNLSTAFKGELNTQYSLRIVSDGKEYTSSTSIPQITRRIDSLFWKKAPGNADSNKGVLMVRATDQSGYGDYIRYFTKRNTELFYPPLNSVYDDQIIDGTTYEVQVERGVDRTQELPDDYTFFDKGDTVTLKLCQINKTTYDFWRTMEFSFANIGNPFSSPTKVLGNISNNALGYFGGYGAQFRTIIIPK